MLLHSLLRVVQFPKIKHLFPSLYLSKNKISLGRWKVKQSIKDVEKKIDWSNHDHCGPCGKFDIKQNNK